jgi:glucuronosyltransferase
MAQIMHFEITSTFLHSPLDMEINMYILLYCRYRENAQRLSRIYRDQPLTPLQQAVYWTEYVIRHKGAPHLRSAVLDLAWYQYFLLDVIAVLAIVVGSVVVIGFLVLRALCRKLFGGRTTVQRADISAKKRA